MISGAMFVRNFNHILNKEFNLIAEIEVRYNEQQEVIIFTHQVEQTNRIIEVVSKPIKQKLILTQHRALKKLRAAENEFHKQLREVYPSNIILHKLHIEG